MLRPSALEQYEWSALQNLNRYIGVTVFVVICLLIDCNNFFYKFLVWIPPNHDLLKYRLLLWGFVAIATSKEWYEYVSNPYCKILGPFAWLTFYVSLIELSSVYKFAVETNSFTDPFPAWIWYCWYTVGILYSWGFYVAFRNGQKQK